MITSPAQTNDIEIRQNILETLAVCVRMLEKTSDPYWREAMEFYAAQSLRLKTRIETYDYSEDDAMIRRVDKSTCEFKKMLI